MPYRSKHRKALCARLSRLGADWYDCIGTGSNVATATI